MNEENENASSTCSICKQDFRASSLAEGKCGYCTQQERAGEAGGRHESIAPPDLFAPAEPEEDRAALIAKLEKAKERERVFDESRNRAMYRQEHASLHDSFACAAMSSFRVDFPLKTADELARGAYDIADAMLEERRRRA